MFTVDYIHITCLFKVKSTNAAFDFDKKIYLINYFLSYVCLSAGLKQLFVHSHSICCILNAVIDFNFMII